MKLIAAPVLALFLANPGPAAAQSDATADRVLKGFSDCRRIADPAQRLDCFDKAASALETAVKSKEVRIVDRSDLRKAKRSLFGFTLPRIDLFGGGREETDADAFTEINTTVAWTRPADNNRIQIGLADESGAVWQTTDPVNWPPKQGAKIRIRKGAMGNYFIQADGGMRARGTRLR